MTTRPIRVAFVLHVFDTGGLERCVATLANHLSPEEFEFTIYCMQRSGSASRWLERSGLRVVELHKGMGNRPTLVPHLAREFRDSRIDIVHSHNWATLVECAIARRIAGVPAHLHAEHGRLLEMTDPNASALRRFLRRKAMRWSLGSAGRLVVVSDESLEIVKRHKLAPEARAELVLNGIDLEGARLAGSDSAAVREEAGVPVDAILAGTVGRLDPIKGLEVALDAVAQAARQVENLHFMIVGDGPDRERLEETARQLDIADRVHFVGIRTDVFRWLGAMDMFVNSSHSEGMSIALLEAMASGRPIVATAVGYTPRLLGGEPPAGVLVPRSAPDALRDALVELASNRDESRAMGARASERCRNNYSAEAMCQHYRRIYRQLVDRPDPGR